MTKSCAARHPSRFSAGNRTPLQLRAQSLLSGSFARSTEPTKPLFTAEQLHTLQQAAQAAEEAAAGASVAGATEGAADAGSPESPAAVPASRKMKHGTRRKAPRSRKHRSTAGPTTAAAATAAAAALRAATSSPALLDECVDGSEDDLSFMTDLLLTDDPHLTAVLGHSHKMLTAPAPAAALPAAGSMRSKSNISAGAAAGSGQPLVRSLPAGAAGASQATSAQVNQHTSPHQGTTDPSAAEGAAEPTAVGSPPDDSAAARPAGAAQPIWSADQQQRSHGPPQSPEHQLIHEPSAVVRGQSGALLLTVSAALNSSTADCLALDHLVDIDQSATDTAAATNSHNADTSKHPAGATAPGAADDLMAVDQILADITEDSFMLAQQGALLSHSQTQQQQQQQQQQPAPLYPELHTSAQATPGFSFQALLMSEDAVAAVPPGLAVAPWQSLSASTGFDYSMPLQAHHPAEELVQLGSMALPTVDVAAAAATEGWAASHNIPGSSTANYYSHQQQLMLRHQQEQQQLQDMFRREKKARRKERKRLEKLQRHMLQQHLEQHMQNQHPYQSTVLPSPSTGFMQPAGYEIPPSLLSAHSYQHQQQPMLSEHQQSAPWEPASPGHMTTAAAIEMSPAGLAQPQHQPPHPRGLNTSSSWQGAASTSSVLPSVIAADLAGHAIGPTAAPLPGYPVSLRPPRAAAAYHRGHSAGVAAHTSQGPRGRHVRGTPDPLVALSVARAAQYGMQLQAQQAAEAEAEAAAKEAATAAEAAEEAAAPPGPNQLRSAPPLLLPGFPVPEDAAVYQSNQPGGNWQQNVLQGVVLSPGNMEDAPAAAAAAAGGDASTGSAATDIAPGVVQCGTLSDNHPQPDDQDTVMTQAGGDDSPATAAAVASRHSQPAASTAAGVERSAQLQPIPAHADQQQLHSRSPHTNSHPASVATAASGDTPHHNDATAVEAVSHHNGVAKQSQTALRQDLDAADVDSDLNKSTDVQQPAAATAMGAATSAETVTAAAAAAATGAAVASASYVSASPQGTSPSASCSTHGNYSQHPQLPTSMPRHVPCQQPLQPHHLQHLQPQQQQQQQGVSPPSASTQWTSQGGGQHVLHAPYTGAAPHGPHGLPPHSSGLGPGLPRSSSSLTPDAMQQQQQQQQQLGQMAAAGGLLHQLSPSEATLMAAGAAAGLSQQALGHNSVDAFLSHPQQQQQQPSLQSSHQPQGRQRRRGQVRGLRGLTGSSGHGAGVPHVEVNGGMDLASSSSILRTSSGKVLRMLSHPVTGKPLLLGPAVDAKTSRLGNTSLGAPAPQLFGGSLQPSKVQSSKALAEQRWAAAGAQGCGPPPPALSHAYHQEAAWAGPPMYARTITSGSGPLGDSWQSTAQYGAPVQITPAGGVGAGLYGPLGGVVEEADRMQAVGGGMMLHLPGAAGMGVVYGDDGLISHNYGPP